MYISENVNGKYCYACETVWDKGDKKYSTPGKCIGQIGPDGALTSKVSPETINPSNSIKQ